MELSVKERLVGAAILVGIMVILVPEMLSGPKDTETTSGTTDTGAVRTYTIDLSAPTTQPAQKPPVEPAPEAIPDPIASPSTSTATDIPHVAADPTPVAAPEPIKPAPAIPKPEPSRTASVPQESTPTTNARPSSNSASSWAVQLGSFASAVNAKKLTTDLRAKGYEAFVSSTGSGAKARHRVRVGPTDTRAEADKLAQRLKRDGHQVAVVSNS